VSELPRIQDEVASSIARTFRAEARRNELQIARVRLGAGLVLGALELYFAWEGLGVAAVYRLPTLALLLIGLALYTALRRGFWHAALPLVVPLVDFVFLSLRLQLTFQARPLASLEEGMELATVIGLAAIIGLSGAFRLTPSAMWISGSLAMLLYLSCAVQTRLGWGEIALQATILGAVIAIGHALTRQVGRAVRSEVTEWTLRRLLPEHVVDGAHADPIALLTRPRAVDATVLVTDIRGFTAWAERRDPMEVLAFLNVVQGALAEAVRRHGGTVDKFMGDGMLAVFGAPEPLSDHAERALAAAREMTSVMDEVRARHPDAAVRVGIGLHSGPLVVGCLGSGPRLEFTILGDTVNTASRLEALTKDQGVPLLASGELVGRVGAHHGLRPLGKVAIRGRQDGIEVFTLLEPTPS
jgi:class 3 adenylate cyclase